MTYRVVWAEPAIDTAAGYLADDPDGLCMLMDSIDGLVHDSRPATSVELGTSGLRRLLAGRYRVLYEVDEDENVVTVIHLGRLG